MLKANKVVTNLCARETFTNVEIEALLRNHNVALNLDQSVKRLKENVVLNFPTSEELSKFYEDFEEAFISLGNKFKPEKKVIKDIFVSKFKPSSFQQVIKNETGIKEIYPDFTTVFVKAYHILLDAKNASATVGWYNQTVAPVASMIQVVIIRYRWF
jgi:hypothetical protein